jgi:undecaprenyl-diphosphatase
VKRDNSPILLPSTAAFLVCSVAAGAGLFRRVDHWILDLAQRNTSAAMDAVGLVASIVGSVEFVAVAVVAIATGLLVEGQRRLASRMLTAFVITGLIELAMKMFLPQAPVPESVLQGQDPFLLDLETPYPYPSGHMLRIVLLLGVVYMLRPNRLGGVAILLFLGACAAGRVYLGTHWPSDLVGGALLGVAALAWVFKKSSKDR